MPNIQQSAVIRQEPDHSNFPSHKETKRKRPVIEQICPTLDPSKNLPTPTDPAGAEHNQTKWHVDNYTDGRSREEPVYHDPQFYLETYTGGKVVKLSQRKQINEKSAMAYGHANKNHVRGDRTPSIGFSRKSQDNLRTKLGMLNEIKLSKVKCLFLTCTLDGNDHIGQLTTPRQFAKYRNNLLTQLRKRLKGLKWFYVARTERQNRGSLHLHISVHGLAFLNQNWLQHTWSRIVLGKAEYEQRCLRSNLPKTDPNYYPLIRTQVERAKNWGQVKQYFSKTLAYLSKSDVEEQKQAEYVKSSMKGDVWNELSSEEIKEVLEIKEYLSIGRIWSIGRYEVYYQFVDGKLERVNASEYYKLRRMIIGQRKSLWRKQGKCMSKWKELERYLLRGYTRKQYKNICIIVDPLEYDIKMYMNEYDIKRMVDHVRKESV